MRRGQFAGSKDRFRVNMNGAKIEERNLFGTPNAGRFWKREFADEVFQSYFPMCDITEEQLVRFVIDRLSSSG